ncbi:FAD/NADP-binding domain-containing protein [Dacryopinax primogenitus]|uniref:FAD/NADP-binding domain-containing protein n=1 Tax=Dacryopinax primogenitus (strain DJM 731) TaxID=1858805 RepID=M5FVX4_DACPD|nr:FAD/NADP-binding domain-containing protein [Dacryopinax primogenitus]EJU02001.1 FAD/NADP-binding domain-containing protein [Dacryopinax primogenitus]
MPDPSEIVGIIGAGAAGLITAHTLVKDGFPVQVLTRDRTPGGVWAAERIYPGLEINNVHGEFRFSALGMPPPSTGSGRLGGEDLNAYMKAYAHNFLHGCIRYGVEVEDVSENPDGEGYILSTRDLKNGKKEQLRFRRVVLCTGGCSAPHIPPEISPTAAKNMGFKGPVLHSQEFGKQKEDVLAACEAVQAVIVGGGKSAQDIAAYLANHGTKVLVIFESTDAVLACPVPWPDFIRRSRVLSIMSPSRQLPSLLEQFLHKTRLGAKIVHGFWAIVSFLSFFALSIPPDSPLRRSHSIFWSIRTNDEGIPSPTRFHSLVNKGAISLISPARAIGFCSDRRSVRLADGRAIPAGAVILATGYGPSWGGLLSVQTMKNVGLERHPPTVPEMHFHNLNYASLASEFNPTEPGRNPHDTEGQWASALYRGIAPVQNLAKRDFAVNGAIFTTNNGYVFETVAHWISSYFLGDPLRLPPTIDEARMETEKNAAWMRKRHPGMLGWANESYAASIAFWNWPQAMDELLEDMDLPANRSGGHWLTWPFRVIDLKEIANLTEERCAKRSLDPASSPRGMGCSPSAVECV